MKFPPSSAAALEPLEARLAPAGLVSLSISGGVLTITGDAQANDMQITDAGGGNWAIAPTAGGTTLFRLNGAPAAPGAVFAAPASIRATLNAGDDRLDLTGLSLTGSLTVYGNDGNDQLFLTNVGVRGATLIDTANGNDDIDFNSTQFENTVTVRGGAHNDYLSGGGTLFFGRGLTADLGTTGANTFDFNATSLQSNGNISVTAGGAAFDTQAFQLALGSSQINGTVTLRNSSVSPTDFQIGSLPGDSLVITGGLTLQGGTGNDIARLTQGVQVGGALSIQLSNGNNELRTVDLTSFNTRTFAYGGGTGTDLITLNGAPMSTVSTMSVVAGAGTNTFVIDANLSVGGNLSFSGGTGNDTMTVEAATVAVAGGLGFAGGDGTNVLDLNTSSSLRIGGGLSYSGGTGIDNLFFGGPDSAVTGTLNFSGSNGANYLGINAVQATLGALTYSGGTGTDVVDVGEFSGASALVSIGANVAIGTGAGSSDVLIRDASIRGNLSVSSSVAFGGVDTVQILETDVYGTTTLRLLGAADTDVVVRDSIFDRQVDIATGGGDDYVAFDTDTAVSSIYSQFYGAVKIDLGAGNDIFAAGSNPAVDTVGNDFYSYVDVFGGTGYDRAYFIHYAYNNGFNGPLPWTSAEEYY